MTETKTVIYHLAQINSGRMLAPIEALRKHEVYTI